MPPKKQTPQKRPTLSSGGSTAKKQAVEGVLRGTRSGSCRLPGSEDDESAPRKACYSALVIGEEMQASLGRFMLRASDIGPLLFGAGTTASGHWGRSQWQKVFDVVFSDGDPDAQDRWLLAGR